MKNFKKSHDIAGQSNIKVQKSQKHDANLQKNSTLYFQIGLILCLLATYAIFEMEFKSTVFKPDMAKVIDDEDITFEMKNYVVEKEMVKQKPQDKKIVKLIDQDPVIVPNDTPDFIEKPVDVVPTVTSVMKPGDIDKIEEPIDDIEIFDMRNVEVVPIYPGCEKSKTNQERIKCMSKKIGKLVQRKFDTNIATDYGLSGMQRIDVQFKIDNLGNVTEIKTRAVNKALMNEAERVAKKIPQMTPGKQRRKPVSVIYNLPIMFQVER
ncbi:energy transducer TonB [uncultured Psychroserpens sp.]|uniref:energy transducer TonB n=1 Tax=uncultured Psychroserpens sp. TaxID=255436 RepID=UPI0026093F01|nr:energy transducer TonB [uncultured Psychroserpens sp.]